MNEDDVNEFTPDEIAPSEFNPYENNSSKSDDYIDFLDDNDSVQSFEQKESSSNLDSTDLDTHSNYSEKLEDNISSDDDDIDLPDFMKTKESSTMVKENDEFNPESDSSSKEYSKEEIGKKESIEESEDDNPYKNQNFVKNEEDTEIIKNNLNNTKQETDDSSNFSGGDTSDAPKSINFQSKISAEDADKKHKSKPKVLNKKFILTVLIIVLGGALLITFLMPTGKKDKTKTEKPVAEVSRSTDYEAMAKKQPKENDDNHYQDIDVNNDNNKIEKTADVEIPPVIERGEKQPYNLNTINYNSGKGNGMSSSTIEIPDTRNDRLQAKSISGIKGLTPSQASYSTDYQTTIEKNTRTTPLSDSYTLPSKEEYMSNILGVYSQAYGNANSNSYAIQNDQAGKNSFYKEGRNANNVGQGEFLNLNTLWQGTIFEATLTSELNTDLPGEITARITKNIYSSQDGRYLLIPQNSIVYGTYNSSISYSQNRVQVVWNTLVRPDGYQIQLGSMNGTDAKGASGLKGFVNDHPLAYLKAIGLMSVFSIVNSEFDNAMGQTNNQYVQNIMANSQNVTMELADKLIDRAMNVQPTIKIKAGTKINIVVNQNLSLPPCEDIPVTQPYQRKK